MFKITGSPNKLSFPLDKFTLPAGDSEHKSIPPRVLARLKNMAAMNQLKLEESEPKDEPKAKPAAREPTRETAPATREPATRTTAKG